MDNKKYRPSSFLVIVIVVIVVQYLSMSYFKKDIEERITQCYEAINTSSIMQGALVNILEEKQIIEKGQFLEEVKKLSTGLKEMIENLDNQEKQRTMLMGKNNQNGYEEHEQENDAKRF